MFLSFGIFPLGLEYVKGEKNRRVIAPKIAREHPKPQELSRTQVVYPQPLFLFLCQLLHVTNELLIILMWSREVIYLVCMYVCIYNRVSETSHGTTNDYTTQVNFLNLWYKEKFIFIRMHWSFTDFTNHPVEQCNLKAGGSHDVVTRGNTPKIPKLTIFKNKPLSTRHNEGDDFLKFINSIRSSTE